MGCLSIFMLFQGKVGTYAQHLPLKLGQKKLSIEFDFEWVEATIFCSRVVRKCCDFSFLHLSREARGFIYLSQGFTYIRDHSRIVLSIFSGKKIIISTGKLLRYSSLTLFSSESIVILVFRFNFKFPVRLL